MLSNDPVTSLPYIGETKAKDLNDGLGIFTVKDLLFHFPRYYQDTSEITMLSDFSTSIPKTALVEIIKFNSVRIKGGRTIQSAEVTDSESIIKVTWFNQHYLKNTFKPGDKLLISGKLNKKKSKPELNSPSFEKIIDTESSLHLGRIVPVYSLTNGISQKWLRKRISELVRKIDQITDIYDDIPSNVREKYSLLLKKEALKIIHMPKTTSDIQAARRRLGFDELLDIQKKLITGRKNLSKLSAKKINPNMSEVNKLLKQFPFQLSSSQLSAIASITERINSYTPLRTLLQGDVGSGKTAVAIVTAFAACTDDRKVIVLAPTVILAEQLFKAFREKIPEEYSIIFHSGKQKAKPEDLEHGDIIIGTHALIEKSKVFKKNPPDLLIIDEQHRFGVKQRTMLQNILMDKSKKIHTLQLTATPIPRTIAMTLFADVDVISLASRSDRRNVATSIVPREKRTSFYSWIHTQLINGEQIFWVVPAIEDSDNNLKSLEEMYKKLCDEFGQGNILTLHGKMSESEKSNQFNTFKNSKGKILLSTTVIEVGIDVPNSKVIIIESAERFGLAQLHQLRGRVGRKGQEAWCLLFTTNDEVSERLISFTKIHDGKELAIYDLQDRGPGEVYGQVQSGIPSLKIANFSNIKIMEEVIEVANLLYY